MHPTRGLTVRVGAADVAVFEPSPSQTLFAAAILKGKAPAEAAQSAGIPLREALAWGPEYLAWISRQSGEAVSLAMPAVWARVVFLATSRSVGPKINLAAARMLLGR